MRFPCVSALWGISGNEWPAGVGGMRETGFCRDEGRPAGRVEESRRFFMQVRAGRGDVRFCSGGKKRGNIGKSPFAGGTGGRSRLVSWFFESEKVFVRFFGKAAGFFALPVRGFAATLAGLDEMKSALAGIKMNMAFFVTGGLCFPDAGFGMPFFCRFPEGFSCFFALVFGGDAEQIRMIASGFPVDNDDGEIRFGTACAERFFDVFRRKDGDGACILFRDFSGMLSGFS